jgi:hypothetical protein
MWCTTSGPISGFTVDFSCNALVRRVCTHLNLAKTTGGFSPKTLFVAGVRQRVEVISYAVGNEDGTAEFQVDDLTSNSGTLDVVTGGKPSASRVQYGLPPRTVRVPLMGKSAAWLPR